MMSILHSRRVREWSWKCLLQSRFSMGVFLVLNRRRLISWALYNSIGRDWHRAQFSHSCIRSCLSRSTARPIVHRVKSRWVGVNFNVPKIMRELWFNSESIIFVCVYKHFGSSYWQVPCVYINRHWNLDRHLKNYVPQA